MAKQYNIIMNKKEIAQRIFDGELAKNCLDSKISELLDEYHPDIDWNYDLRFDWYDASVEIDFEKYIPYPWEPNMEIRKKIMEYGFCIVYWNFPDGGDGVEEIRGYEPRRIRNYQGHKHIQSIGYVDHRFNYKEWMENYGKFR